MIGLRGLTRRENRVPGLVLAMLCAGALTFNGAVGQAGFAQGANSLGSPAPEPSQSIAVSAAELSAVGGVAYVTGSTSGPARPGDIVRFEISMLNSGTLAVTHINSTAFQWPQGLTAVAGSGAIVSNGTGWIVSDLGFSGGSLQPGEGAAYTVDAFVDYAAPAGAALWTLEVNGDGVVSIPVVGRLRIAGNTVITVTTATDSMAADGLCSLREAVIAANAGVAEDACPAGTGSDTIVFSPSLPLPVTVVLTRTGSTDDSALTGDLDLIRSVAIVAPAPQGLVLDGNGTDRVLEILPGAKVVLSGAIVRHGDPGAAGVGGGALVDAGGVFTATGSSLVENHALIGAGVAVSGTLHLLQSTVGNNQGDGIAVSGGWIELRASQVISNTSGFGIRARNWATVGVDGGTISGNAMGGIHAIDSAVTISGASITGNEGAGGVHSEGPSHATLWVNATEVRGNTGSSGAGIASVGIGATAVVSDSTLSGNVASGAGGAIYNTGAFSLVQSLVSANSARTGGGIDHSGGNLHLTNVTLDGNQALDNGGGIYSRAHAIVEFSTFAGNAAGTASGGDSLFVDGTTIAVGGSILVDQVPAGNCATDQGAILSQGSNIENGDSCAFGAAGDQANTDPALQPLGAYGGATQSRALPAASPAVDAALVATCPLVDQRGMVRPYGAACDAGAYEWQPMAASGPLYFPLLG